MNTYTHKASKFEVKDFDDKTRMVKGYASVFDNSDSDSDVIFKGAFNKSVSEWGPEGKDRIKLLAQHDMSRPIAKITGLKEDTNGLFIEAKFGTHTDGDDYYRMAKEGIINEFSVGFVPIQKEKNEKDGYDIKEIKLYEVSMVTIAANDEAVVTDVKNNNDVLKLIKQVDDDKLQFNLEREVLKLMSDSQETNTPADSEVAPQEESLEPIVEVKEDNTIEQLNLLFKTQ